MSEEEKNIETIIDEIEAENDVKIETEPETEDDVREAFEINKEDGPLAALGAPMIKAAGDPDPADPNMIQKHLDNFLAMLCGETPIDDNVRNSTEYWLKRLADGNGGSVKKQYQHNISVLNSTNTTYIYSFSLVIFNNDDTPFTKTDLLDFLTAYGDGAYPVSGLFRQLSPTDMNMSLSGVIKDGNVLVAYGIDNNGAIHGKSTNPLNFKAQYDAAATFVSDNVLPIN